MNCEIAPDSAALLERIIALTDGSQLSDGILTVSMDDLDSEAHRVHTASDIVEPPERVVVQITRIVRDTACATRVKILHRHLCQICGQAIQLSDGLYYSEAHHIKPLGRDHNGPDVDGNILCLCPNHHAMCDFGAIRLDLRSLRTNDRHRVDEKFIEYHNRIIYRMPSARLGNAIATDSQIE